MSKKALYFTLGTLFGTASGILAGMLLAPRSGAESRAMAADAMNDAWDSAVDTYERGAQTAADNDNARRGAQRCCPGGAGQWNAGQQGGAAQAAQQLASAGIGWHRGWGHLLCSHGLSPWCGDEAQPGLGHGIPVGILNYIFLYINKVKENRLRTATSNMLATAGDNRKTARKIPGRQETGREISRAGSGTDGALRATVATG